MRWDALFDDLEAQAALLAQAERAAEIETRTRGEIASLALVDRLRAATGRHLRLRVAGGLDVVGELVRVGPDWLLVVDAHGRETVVVTGRLVGVRGLGRSAATPGAVSAVESRLGLRHALRGIARDRAAVRVHRDAGGAYAGSYLESGTGGVDRGATADGTIDRVGSDFLELAAHSAGEQRRRSDVREVELIPLAAVTAVVRSV